MTEPENSPQWNAENTISKYSASEDFSLLHNVQTGSGAHPAFVPMDNGG
jgi:hypothetical protein